MSTSNGTQDTWFVIIFENVAYHRKANKEKGGCKKYQCDLLTKYSGTLVVQVEGKRELYLCL